jgi:hypothetical protein
MRYTKWDIVTDIWENFAHLTQDPQHNTKLQALVYMRKPEHKLSVSDRRKLRAKTRKIKNHTIKYVKADCYKLTQQIRAVINL